jgi:hypothetical protein
MVETGQQSGVAIALAASSNASARGAKPALLLTTFTQGAYPASVRREGF